MSLMTAMWLGLALVGFVLGLFVGPMVLLRIAIGLFLLAGAGLVLSNTAGWEGAAYWLGVGMAALAVIFGVAIIGALAGWLVRKMVGVDDKRVPPRQYNSILPD